MIVLDSSAYIEALIRPPDDPLRLRISAVPRVHVPDGFDIEVLNVLRRLALRGILADRAAATEVACLAGWGQVERYPVVPLLPAMWRLRASVTGYDAAYVALATRLDLPLVTTDIRLSTASPTLPCAIEPF